MRVQIDHYEEKKGFFSSKKFYGVRCTVQFNEEEKAIIKERDIDTVIIMERGATAGYGDLQFAADNPESPSGKFTLDYIAFST